MPLRRAPGHAQVDFGEALAEIAGFECTIHLFAMGLPFPSGEGRLAVGGVRMRDAGLELELAIAQDRCLTRRSSCWGG